MSSLKKYLEVYFMSPISNKEKCDACGGTLCWKCENAVPSSDGTRGCPWSTQLKPVDGWDAVESSHDHKIYGLADKGTNELIINKSTGDPVRFASRSKAIKSIHIYGDSNNLRPVVIDVERKVSYYVRSCPMFKRG